MSRTFWSARRLAPLGVLAVVSCAAGAQAAGGGSAAPKPSAPRAVSATVPVARAPVPVLPAAAGHTALSPAVRVPFACRPPGKKAAAAAPSDALKRAFGILRRERTDDDALPARALAALKAHGLNVVDPEAARLLRADRRARAWVVPVPDVATAPTIICRGPAARGAGARARARARGGARAHMRAATAPREGLAVVAVGGAPSGGGGALRDLERGIAGPTLDPCAGTGHDMLGVSGIVPDRVDAVFVTAADGSATRADVHDNGYAFVLPRPRRPESRYVVWTGANGTPHVQPMPAFVMSARAGACRQPDEIVRVTPDRWGAGCGPLTSPALVLPRSPRAARRAQQARRSLRAAKRARRGSARVVRPRRRGRIPARRVAPVLPAPMDLPLALSLTPCATVDLAPMLLPGVPHAVPPPVQVVPGVPFPARPRRPRAVPPQAAAPVPRATPAPTVPAVPGPVPPRAP